MGTAKAELRIANKPILSYLLEKIAWPGPTLLVTAPGREHPPGSEPFGKEALDPVAGEGPLRGILTALRNARTPAVVITTVDMPAIEREHLDWLAGKLAGSTECHGVMIQRMIDGKSVLEPFPLACRVEAAEFISQSLAEGKRAVRTLLGCGRFIIEPAPKTWAEDAWTNLNTPQDWERFLRSRGAGA